MAITTIAAGRMEASVDSRGAQLMSLRRDGVEYLWQGDERWWPRRAPVLFPIVGKLRGGVAQTAQGEARMGQHGIARDFEHELVGDDGRALTYELASTERTRASFPFDFTLRMSYGIVGEAALEQRFTVANTGDVDLPFCVGGHPAFNVPLAGTDDDFSDFELRFSRPWTWASPTQCREQDGLIDWGTTIALLDDSDVLPLTHRSFDVDTLFFQGVPDDTVTLVSRRSGRGVRVDFPGFPLLGVWSAAGDAPFIAVEPWTGIATGIDEDDVFEHKRGMTLLAPGAVWERAFTVTLL